MNNNTPQGGFFTKKNENEKPNKKNYETLTPVTIDWLKAVTKNLQDDTVKMDNKILDKIIICGFINSHRIDNNKFFLNLQDGFGSIEIVVVKKFDENIPVSLKNIDLESKNYLRVVLNVFSNVYKTKEEGQKEVIYTGISFEKIDLMFFTYHLVNCLTAKKVRIEGRVSNHEPNESNASKNQYTNNNHNSSNIKNNYENGENRQQNISLSEKIFIMVSRIAKGGGSFNINMIHNEFDKRISLNAIQDAFNEFVENGKIYKDPGTRQYNIL